MWWIPPNGTNNGTIVVVGMDTINGTILKMVPLMVPCWLVSTMALSTMVPWHVPMVHVPDGPHTGCIVNTLSDPHDNLLLIHLYSSTTHLMASPS